MLTATIVALLPPVAVFLSAACAIKICLLRHAYRYYSSAFAACGRLFVCRLCNEICLLRHAYRYYSSAFAAR